MNITILGAGYVGLTTAALFASSGNIVYALEPNLKRLKVIKQGKSFFYEEGLDNIIDLAIKNKSLIPTDSYAESIPKSDIVFSSVGTPDKPDGSSDLSHVFAATKEALKYLKDGSIFVQKSTVPVGTGRKLEELFNQSSKRINYVSNPEFLREGTALQDTLYFDRVVAGSDNKDAIEIILNLYRDLEKQRDNIADSAKITKLVKDGSYIATDLNSAELIKVTANAFLALKISFANSIAKLSDRVGADVTKVMDAVGADERIGRKFLNAGRGYGGGCFPKDVSGLIASGREYGVELNIMTAAQIVNSSMPEYIINKLEDVIKKPLNNLKITVLGLSFKAGTSDVRRSPGIAIANILQQKGAAVLGYDPKANDEAKADLNKNIILVDSIKAATVGSEVVIIATDWPEFLEYDLVALSHDMVGAIFVDSVNRFNKQSVTDAGFTYIGVGR
jgi:UDPglucose 6-dehydrogenase